MTTFASVTDKPCTFDWLQNLADEPSSPIAYDHRGTSEYQIRYVGATGEVGSIVLYHGPFCGGTCPKSTRGSLFAVVPKSEEDRIYKLFEAVRTIEDSFSLVGKPDIEQTDGAGTYSAFSETEPTKIERFRTIIYTQLSDVADVRVTDYLR